MFFVATTMATISATLISVSVLSVDDGVESTPVAPECEPVVQAPTVPQTPPAAPRIPKVRQAKSTVTGAMSTSIIRRIVRAHINEVRYCYNEGLAHDPDLEGRVVVQFKIDPEGKVAESEVASSTVPNDAVGTCIAGAVERWKFPRPGDGDTAVVTYPFVLSAE